MNSNQKKKLQAAFDVLEVICDDVSDSMPVRQALAFLTVALYEGVEDVTPPLVANATGSNTTVASRDLLMLGSAGRPDARDQGKKGHGLVAVKPDYRDMRRRPYVLTKKGEAVIHKAMEAV